MSVGYKSSSIIGGALDPDVITQLQERSKKLKNNSRTREDITYLTSKTSWVKLSSSVNVQESPQLAKSSILFGGGISVDGKPKSGFEFNSNNPSYKIYDSVGIRPMPGITDTSITSKNTFGTLREAAINFKCWSVEQLSDMEKLYMRPGFTVVLEWGNTVYVDNKGNISSEIVALQDFFDGNYTKEQVIGKIQQLKEDSSNNYDGFFGYVKNFQWSYNQDGGYDCTCNVITMGEIIESISLLVTPEQAIRQSQPREKQENSETVVATEIEQYETALHLALYAIKNANLSEGQTGTGEFKKKVPVLYDKVAKALGNKRLFEVLYYGVNNRDGLGKSDYADTLKYISVRDFLILLNESFMIGESADSKLVKFSFAETKSLFFTFPSHLGLDLGVCLLPKNRYSKKTLVYDISKDGFAQPDEVGLTISEEIKYIKEQQYKNFSKNKIAFEEQKVQNVRNSYSPHESILNIWLNVEMVIEELNKLIKTPNVSHHTVLKLVRNVMDRVQTNLGGVNQFDLHYEEEIFTYFLVDRVVVPDDGLPVLDLTGLGSTVSNISLTSKITPALSTMLAVSAQAQDSDIAIDTENMFRWNEGLTDRIIPKKVLNDTLNAGKNILNLETFESLFNYVKNVNEKRNYIKAEVEGLKTLHSTITKFLAKSAARQDKKSAAGIIPFELNLTLDGIGGIKIGQAFKINDGILPETYNDTIGFLINGVDHKISSNRWLTNIKAQTILLQPENRNLSGNIAEEVVDTVAEVLEQTTFKPDSNGYRYPVPTIKTLGVSDNVVNIVKQFEGFSEKAYVDPGSQGKPITIGYGTTTINNQPVLIGQTVTEREADTLLRQDLLKFGNTIKNYIKVELTQNEYDALLSFAYNVGTGNFKASTLLRKINEKQYIAASEEFLRWTKASGKELKGLIKRRAAEKQLFLTNNPGDPT